MPRLLAFGLPLLLFAPDAFAWGLQTHVFFGQCALLGLPFADRQLREAAARLPALVLAGACLPDLALAGGALGTPAFRRAHRWSTLRRLAAAPRDDAGRALALGYATHLVVDVVAHNHFVPEHEVRIARVRYATHALAEWAMDRHVESELEAQPAELLRADRTRVAGFVASGFRCDVALACRALDWLAGAEQLLRRSPLPHLSRTVVRVFDRHASERFDRYVRKALSALHGTEAALSGALVDWVASDPEGSGKAEHGDAAADRRAGQHVARIVQAKHHP